MSLMAFWALARGFVELREPIGLLSGVIRARSGLKAVVRVLGRYNETM